MGRTRVKNPNTHPLTLPPSPSHSSSSSDFEFTISLSPSSRRSPPLCPADELFYKGQLLPLHLSPRLSMVRTLLLASSSMTSSSSADTATTASRDSNGSSTDSSYGSDLALLTECDSSRPSSVTEDDELRKQQSKKSRSFSSSLAKFSSVFRRDPKSVLLPSPSTVSNTCSSKRISTPAAAKEVIRKYMKKVKPLYEKFRQYQQRVQQEEQEEPNSVTCYFSIKTERSSAERTKENKGGNSHSFSGNLRYPRRRSCISSCPSSMRSSPSHSGVLGSHGSSGNYSDTSSMEELQNAIQGAIAHCKGSMIQSNLKKGADG